MYVMSTDKGMFVIEYLGLWFKKIQVSAGYTPKLLPYYQKP